MVLDLMDLLDVLDLLIGIYEFGRVRILLDLDRIGIELLLLRLMGRGELIGNVM
jgi:hypothetical protein